MFSPAVGQRWEMHFSQTTRSTFIDNELDSYSQYKGASWASIDGLGSFGLSGGWDPYDWEKNDLELQGQDTLSFGEKFDSCTGCVTYSINGEPGEACGLPISTLCDDSTSDDPDVDGPEGDEENKADASD